MALVTLEELKDYMDFTLTNTQEDAAQLVLDGLQDELEFVIRRPAEVRSFTEDWLVLDHGGSASVGSPFYGSGSAISYGGSYVEYAQPTVIYLSQSPVVTVSSVTQQNFSTSSPTTLTAGTDYSVAKFGIYVYGAQVNSRITVSYTAGIDGTTLPYFKLVLLRAAAREMQNMHDDTVGLKDLTTRNVAPLTTGFTDSEVARLSRYKRKRI